MQSKHRERPYSKPPIIQFSHIRSTCVYANFQFLSSTLLIMLSSQLYGHNTNHVRSGVLADSKIELTTCMYSRLAYVNTLSR